MKNLKNRVSNSIKVPVFVFSNYFVLIVIMFIIGCIQVSIANNGTT